MRSYKEHLSSGGTQDKCARYEELEGRRKEKSKFAPHLVDDKTKEKRVPTCFFF